MASFTPDFEKHYHSESFSDVDLELVELDAEVGGKRKRETTIPGHSMVLMAFSNYCKVKLENWNSAHNSSTASSTKKHTIQLPVPVGQLEIATRLIQAMYQKTPAVSDLDQQQSLQLLLLADRFEVPKVQAAVVDALSALSEEELEWNTALSLLDLPFGCEDDPSFKRIVALADKKLLQRFGDLDMVWADVELGWQLPQLSHAALMRLLQHDDTRVANESTVVYTILQWWEKQQQLSYRDSHVQQLKQLMQQIRMQHLSSLYINTHMMGNDAVLSCYSMQELAIACSCIDPVSQQALKDTKCQQLVLYPAWIAAKRPASRRQQVVEWKLPVAQIRSAVEGMLGGKARVVLNGAHGVIQGHVIFIQACLRFTPDPTAAQSGDSGKKLYMSVYCMGGDKQQGATCNVTSQLIAEAAGAEQGQKHKYFRELVYGLRRGHIGGSCRILDVKSVSSWSDVDAALSGASGRRNLVHADDCLHIKVHFKQVV